MTPDNLARQDKYPSGIVGLSVGEIERQVTAGEAPPLPPNAQMAVIGKSVPRINGRAKVTGAARFTVDIMLHGRLLRSPHPMRGSFGRLGIDRNGRSSTSASDTSKGVLSPHWARGMIHSGVAARCSRAGGAGGRLPP